jgi:hypothetical protein
MIVIILLWLVGALSLGWSGHAHWVGRNLLDAY